MKENKIELDDLLNEFLTDLEAGDEGILDRYVDKYPEFRLELRQAAGLRNMIERVPDRNYSAEEEELLTLRAASVVQNLLHSMKKTVADLGADRLVNLVEVVEKQGESVDSFAGKLRLSEIVIRMLSNREVRPGSVPRRAFETIGNALSVNVDTIEAYLSGSPRLSPGHYKASGTPESIEQAEFSSLIEKDPFMNDEDKRYWLSFPPVESE